VYSLIWLDYLRVERVGKVIFFPKGNVELTYAFGITELSNNLGEIYALLQIWTMAQDKHISSLVMVIDSNHIIHYIVVNSIPHEKKFE